jgi:cytochrome P450
VVMAENLDLIAFLADPMGTLARSRGHGSVIHTDDGTAMVIDQDAVRASLADPRLEVNFVEMIELLGVTSGSFHAWMACSPLNNEGEDHRRWRAFMNRAFTPGGVRSVRPFLAVEADRLVADLARRGDVELMADFADILPALGLCELIGVPARDREHFAALAHTIGYGFRPMELVDHLAEVDEAVTQLLDYTAGLLEARRADPRDDLVSHMATTGDESGYAPEQCAAFLAGLVFAGNDTTRNQIGWMVAVLVDRPDLWDAIGTGEVEVETAVEELMRYRSAAPAVTRRAAEPIELSGSTLAAGSPVLLSLWGADSDPGTYPAAADLDPVANAGIPHLGFGHGPHHCLGAALARAELQESLRSMCEHLEPPEVREPIEWGPPIGINGPTRVPLRVRPRAFAPGGPR